MSIVLCRLVNGFSNMFWGWGGEDDDMANRLRNSFKQLINQLKNNS